jgi:hypothetical protein
MEVVRRIVSADSLLPIMDLPWITKNLKVEVIVIPQTEEKQIRRKVSVESLKGCLKEYANPSLWEKEPSAWENHITEKYAIT